MCFKICGVQIKLHTSFFALLWLACYFRFSLWPAIFLCCFLHEMGHLGALTVLHAPPTKIDICLGGISIAANMGTLPAAKRVLVAASGPVVSLVLGWLFYLSGPKGYLLAAIHLSLGIINLLPVLPLDGGRILQAVLPPKTIFWAVQKIVLAAVCCLAVAGVLCGIYGLGFFALYLLMCNIFENK